MIGPLQTESGPVLRKSAPPRHLGHRYFGQRPGSFQCCERRTRSLLNFMQLVADVAKLILQLPGPCLDLRRLGDRGAQIHHCTMVIAR